MKRYSPVIIFTFLCLFLWLGEASPVSADTTPYRSAGWIHTQGSPGYTNVPDGCQKSKDGKYCSRMLFLSYGILYFGSFGEFKDFGIPPESTIDAIRIRISGKTNGYQRIAVANGYHNTAWTSGVCASPSHWLFSLGSTDNSIELYAPVEPTVLGKCLTPNTVNFQNFSFRIGNASSLLWSADIDNFEIAFDYTPPASTPTPIQIPPGQNGTIWQIGPKITDVQQVAGIENAVSVAAGKGHYLALKLDGTVWSWGQNQSGQLGNGTTTSSATPVQVKSPDGNGYFTDVKALAAGEGYSMALKNDGTVWAWGSTVLLPKRVSNFWNVKAIAVGAGHRIVLQPDGTVFAWGDNNMGQLGIGCYLYNCSSRSSPVQVHNLTNVVAISAGDYHSLAVKSDGSVWGWGNGYWGQLGEHNGDQYVPVRIAGLENIKALSSRSFYNLAIDASGSLFEWGGAIKTPEHISGIADVSSFSASYFYYAYGLMGHAVKKDGTLWEVYINDVSPKQVPGLKEVTAVAGSPWGPYLAVIGKAKVPEPTPEPFLDLPWDYEGKGISFNDAALAINSYFDHEYPLLSRGLNLAEPTEAQNTLIPYTGGQRKAITNRFWYSKHDGYDYGSIRAGVYNGDSVYPAAPGIAEYKYDTAGGNSIAIDHGNGYQTVYYHLQDQADGKIGVLKKEVGLKQQVDRSTVIGRVGSTGEKTSGPHIHIGVFQDKNNDGNFHDNVPDGATDPFGWQSKDPDPWEQYSFFYNGKERTGNKSYYLWKKKLSSQEESITPNETKKIVMENYTLDFPLFSVTNTINIKIFSSPSVLTTIDGKQLQSVCTPVGVTAENLFGDAVSHFLLPFWFVVDFTTCDTSRINTDTLSVFSSSNGGAWSKEETTVDMIKKRATALIGHMTEFALLGERLDNQPPVTTATLHGTQGESHWYRSDVSVTLTASDSAEEDAAGVDYILYKKDGEEWQTYSSELLITEEGHHRISFYSGDKDANIEDVKSVEFDIDRIPPQVTIDANPKTMWPPNGRMIDVTIAGSSNDNTQLLSTTFLVEDEYNLIEPELTDFGHVIKLEAKRDGKDTDGRTYTISAVAADKAGNTQSASSIVKVLHDQGH